MMKKLPFAGLSASWRRAFEALLTLPAVFVFSLNISGAAAQVAEIPEETASEIQRFCTNIADVARDRRYALQTEELSRLRNEIDQRMVALEEKRAEYEEWLTRRNVFLARAQESLVAIYASMRPDAAAERLSKVRIELAAAILMQLDPRVAGVILNEMNSQSAAELTTIMASAARPEDPT